MPARIRRAEHDDLDGLIELENRSFSGVYTPHRFGRREFVYYLGNADARTLVARADGRVVGYLLGLFGTASRGRSARILSVAVDPDVRRRGVAGELLARFLLAAKRAGRVRVTTEVWDGNRSAIELFERSGFRKLRRIPDYYGPEQNALRLRRIFENR